MNIVIPHKISVPEHYQQELLGLGAVLYDDTADIAELKERIRDAEAITTRTLTDSPEFDTTAEIIDAAPNLRYIITPSTGFNHIDVAHAASKGIKVLNCATFNSQAVAEHALSLMLATNRCLAEGDVRLRNGTWDRTGLNGYELGGKHVGLIGYGHIGKLLEGMLTALGMQVSYTRSRSTDAETDQLLANSDFVIICAPLTDATRGMIDARRLGLMKPSVVIVNIARGAIINQAELIEALKSGKIRGAGLDVFATEPTDTTPDPEIVTLANLPNTVVMPHTAYLTHEANEKLGAELVADIKSCIEDAPINLINV